MDVTDSPILGDSYWSYRIFLLEGPSPPILLGFCWKIVGVPNTGQRGHPSEYFRVPQKAFTGIQFQKEHIACFVKMNPERLALTPSSIAMSYVSMPER